jgi:gamma-glutamyltranspeptidase
MKRFLQVLLLALALPAQAAPIMVAAANPHAARAGIEILRAGGSAIDAAIAVQMVLNLVEPQSSGIGGGAFALHWEYPPTTDAKPRPQPRARTVSLDPTAPR